MQQIPYRPPQGVVNVNGNNPIIITENHQVTNDHTFADNSVIDNSQDNSFVNIINIERDGKETGQAKADIDAKY